MSTYQCPKCGKSFSNKNSLGGHMGSHNKRNTKAFISKVCVLATRAEILTKNFETYLSKLKTCGCGAQFSGNSQKFCSHHCAASHTNSIRGARTEETKKRISSNVKAYYASINVNKKPAPIKEKKIVTVKPPKVPKPMGRPRIYIGEYCKLYKSKCPHCDTVWFSNTLKRICKDCRLLADNLKHRFRFSFNLYDFPELFDLEKLNEVGFYAPGGKSGSWNPCGLSRDHKVSVSEAAKNDYDPYYITHPINCELMPHTENSAKKGKSSMSYTDLVQLVDQYESNTGNKNLPYKSAVRKRTH